MKFLAFEFQVGSKVIKPGGKKKSKSKKEKKEKLPLEEHEADRISPLHLFHVNTNWSHKKKNREGEFLHLFLKRLQMGRFLLETQATPTISATDANPRTLGGSNSDNKKMATLDTNMVIILAALLCALICALGLNSVLRCVLRCTRRFTPTEDPIDSNENANGAKGIKKQDLKRIPVDSYSLELKMKDTECLICLGEFVDGDKVRALPKCKHGFHVKCIDTWLRSHSSCPTCRQSLIEHQTLADGFHRDDDGTVATRSVTQRH